MNAPRPPAGLDAGGRSLWREVAKEHELDWPQRVQLHEACRAKDRLDKLDAVLRGEVCTWSEIVTDPEGTPISLQITGALGKANETANLLKQLLASLRLADTTTGKRPQQRGPRGAYKPTGTGTSSATAKSTAKVSSLDRARERAEQTGA